MSAHPRPARRAAAFLLLVGLAVPMGLSAQSETFRVSPRAGTPLQDIEQLTTPGGYDKYPAVVYGPDGTLWLASVSMRDDRDRIVVRRKAAAGWGPEERIDEGEGVEGLPRLLATDDGGRIWAVWHGRRNGRWSVYTRVHEGSGWGPEQRLDTPGDALRPAVVRDGQGRIWLAWETPEPGGFAINVAVRGDDGWSRPAVVARGGLDRRAALAPRAAGGVWIAWQSTRTGNFDIWLTHADAERDAAPVVGEAAAVTRDPGIDDAPALTTTPDGAVWIAWNSMRAHRDAPNRVEQHMGDAFVRVFKDGRWWSPPGTYAGTHAGKVSHGNVNKNVADAEDEYWHWRQTQNYPALFTDGAVRVWIVWRTDATGAHNFDLWARVHDGERWSPELRLTDGWSPGRDEWPAAAAAPDGSIRLAWEGQTIPVPGEESKFGGGDVDAYNTLGLPNVVLTARVEAPATGWTDARLAPAPVEPGGDVSTREPRLPGPEPGGVATADSAWQIYFGDLHSHTIYSDAKTGLPEEIYWLFRTVGLDFGALTDHAEMGRLQASEFAENGLVARQFDEDGRFAALVGFEWTAPPQFGHRIVILPHDTASFTLSSQLPAGDDVEELYAYLRRAGGLVSPHHTGQAVWGRWSPAAVHDPSLEPNFEISSWHGRFEFYGNPFEGRRQVPGHHFQDALRTGRQVGVLGSSDAHFLNVGEGGLTAVLARRLDRASVIDALANRRTYATTGARIVLDFRADGAPVGSRLESSGPVELAVRIEGTAVIDRVEIVRNLENRWAAVRLQQTPGSGAATFMLYDPAAPEGGERISAADARRLELQFTDPDPTAGTRAYYVRVTQVDGQQAWSSPIWVERR